MYAKPKTKDARLMVRLVEGDDGALEELMRRWQAPVWCLIDRMCGPLDCTDDVYQECWLRIYLYRARYKPEMPFRPYLFAIAVNCCRSALRRRWASPADAPDGPDLAERLPGSDPRPLDLLLEAERASLLDRAVARLPHAQRAVVLLYLLCSADYAQIAQVLGKRPGTVRSLMHHALCRLRATLGRLADAPQSRVDHERQPRR